MSQTDSRMSPVTLITGASRGIGRSIALRLAQAGHTIINLSRSDPGVDFPGVTYRIDLGLADETMRVLDRVMAENTIDNLVNNAGTARVNPIECVSPEELQQQINLNLRALIQCTQAVLPAMRRKRRGRIVSIGSRAASARKVARSTVQPRRHSPP